MRSRDKQRRSVQQRGLLGQPCCELGRKDSFRTEAHEDENPEFLEKPGFRPDNLDVTAPSRKGL